MRGLDPRIHDELQQIPTLVGWSYPTASWIAGSSRAMAELGPAPWRRRGGMPEFQLDQIFSAPQARLCDASKRATFQQMSQSGHSHLFSVAKTSGRLDRSNADRLHRSEDEKPRIKTNPCAVRLDSEMKAPMLDLPNLLKLRRAKHDQGFDGAAPVTDVSVNFKLGVQRVRLNLCKSGLGAAYGARVYRLELERLQRCILNAHGCSLRPTLARCG